MLAVQITPFELVVVGPGIEATYTLSQQATTIGRSQAAMPDIEIVEEDAAPRHCVVQWNIVAQCHVLRVFGASGAWLNSVLVPGDGGVHPLSAGDQFRIGATTFTYRSTAHPVLDEAADAVDPPTVVAPPISREVYEFEVIPRIRGDGLDWTHFLLSYGPRRRVEAPMQAIRVVISKGTPRKAIVAALKTISDFVEGSKAVTEQSSDPLVTLAQWFDS